MRKIGKALQFRITLECITPAIWRRMLVPARYSFWDLHVAIQDVMGWTDTHLHLFRITNPKTGITEEFGIPDEEGIVGDVPCLAGWKFPIANYFIEPGTKAEYEYDFGDDWQHQVVLEAIVDRIVGKKYPVCVAGERACPPEDCGGVHGYEELIRIIANPSDEEYRNTMEWVGPYFHPEAFVPKQVHFDSPRARLKFAMGNV